MIEEILQQEHSLLQRLTVDNQDILNLLRLREEYKAEILLEGKQELAKLLALNITCTNMEEALETLVKYVAGNADLNELKEALVWVTQDTARSLGKETFKNYWLGYLYLEAYKTYPPIVVLDYVVSYLHSPDNALKVLGCVILYQFYKTQGGLL